MIVQANLTQSCSSTIVNEQGAEVLNFIESHLRLNENTPSLLLDTSSHLNLRSLKNLHGLFYEKIDNVINLKRLNDLKYVNKFLEETNEALSLGGSLVGHIETLRNRKERIIKKYPRPLNRVAYFLDFLVKRVFPKFRYTKTFYFFLTQGKNRVISEMEIYGRLYSCGFELTASKEINGKLWLIGKKIREPAYNNEATYGPLIKLRRHGRDNELFKVYKLRTMYPYSEYLQSYISVKYGLQKGGKFKDDPRVTTAGKFFRKFWIDELPMFINVIKGEMKIFGVRPLSSHYLGLYPEHLKELRAKVKPGLIPPFYSDLPETLKEITDSEEAYLLAYMKSPLLTDVRYMAKALHNIIIKRARSN